MEIFWKFGIWFEFASKIDVKHPRFWYFGDVRNFGIWFEFVSKIGVKHPRFWYFGDFGNFRIWSEFAPKIGVKHPRFSPNKRCEWGSYLFPKQALRVGFLLIFYRITFLFQDLPSSAKVPKSRIARRQGT